MHIRPSIRITCAAATLLILAGCSDQQRAYQPISAPPAHAQVSPAVLDSNAPSVNAQDTETADNAPAAAPVNDPLITPDQLAAGAPQTNADAGTLTDPGPSAGVVTPIDAPAPAVPNLPGTLATQSKGLGSTGALMPTEHTHWLRGDIFGARVYVTLNQRSLGPYQSHLDFQITSLCRKGINTIAFHYEPLQSMASAHLNVLESEHNPPIGPLVTFEQGMPGDTDLGASTGHPASQAYTFFAQ